MTENYCTPQLSNEDISQLRSLSLAFYIIGGITALLSLFPLIHIAVGVGIIVGAMDGNAPPFLGWVFVSIGITLIFIGESMAICMVIAGKHLDNRTGYTFCFVIACIACVQVPIGTILGILSIIVLSRPAVKAAFGKA